MLIAHIIDNKVVNLLGGPNVDVFKKLENEQEKFEEYNIDIHPWGPQGKCDIDVGVGWRTRLKEKLGYCILCGDHLPVPDESGSL